MFSNLLSQNNLTFSDLCFKKFRLAICYSTYNFRFFFIQYRFCDWTSKNTNVNHRLYLFSRFYPYFDLKIVYTITLKSRFSKDFLILMFLVYHFGQQRSIVLTLIDQFFLKKFMILILLDMKIPFTYLFSSKSWFSSFTDDKQQ